MCPVGHWADEEVGWAVAGGVTVGVGGGRFDLDGVVSRAQIVTFLFRVVGLVEEESVVVRVGEVDLAHVDSGRWWFRWVWRIRWGWVRCWRVRLGLRGWRW